jgi:NAD(P)-dependent dehydrogenase (short-subunit alcohol dehydrogenase family)
MVVVVDITRDQRVGGAEAPRNGVSIWFLREEVGHATWFDGHVVVRDHCHRAMIARVVAFRSKGRSGLEEDLVGRLDGKVAFLTGAGSGIARATAHRFAAEGAKVVVVEFDEASGRRTADDLVAAGHDALFVHTDVTDLDAVHAAVAKTIERFGRLDVLFNCAGGSLADDGPVTEVDLALWEPTMAPNVRGTIHCCRAAIPEMARSGGGSIVNMTSICALSGNHPLHLYAAAKGSIISLTKVLAGQYWRDSIRANAIAPGSVLTERVRARMEALTDASGSNSAAEAMGFTTHPFAIGEPEDLANIVLFLASDESRMITGAVIPAEGGLTAY